MGANISTQLFTLMSWAEDPLCVQYHTSQLIFYANMDDHDVHPVNMGIMFTQWRCAVPSRIISPRTSAPLGDVHGITPVHRHCHQNGTRCRYINIEAGRNWLISCLLYHIPLNPSTAASANPFCIGSRGWGMFSHQNRVTGWAKGSIMWLCFFLTVRVFLTFRIPDYCY